MREYFRTYYAHFLQNTDVYRAHTIESAKNMMRELFPGFDAEQVPDQPCTSFFLGSAFKVWGTAEGVRCAVEQIPWLVTIEARDLYMPEPLIRFARGQWHHDHGLALFDACTGAGIRRTQPVVKGPKIGRNQPCPCGSGRKYKRCCGP